MNPQIELNSDTWKEIESYVEARIKSLRIKNDSIGLDAIQTAELRGKIAAFKQVLALSKAPAIDADDSFGY